MRKKACLAAAVALALIVGAVVGLLALRSKAGANYPTTPQGWATRFEDAAGEFGRIPGENWDRWLAVESEIRGQTDPAVVGPALDRLLDARRFTVPVPASIGTEAVAEDLFPDFSVIRDTLRAVILPALDAHLLAGEFDHAAEWVRRAWVLARVSDGSGTIIGGLVNAAVVEPVFASVGVHAGAIGRADAGPLDAALAAAPLPDAVWSLRLEREMALSIASDTHAGLLTAADQLRILDRLYLDWAAHLEHADEAASRRVLTVMARLENDPLFRARRPALAMIVTPFDRYSRLISASATRHDALLVLIALERWRAANGAYPDSLGALVPGLLPAVPVDPFANGAPLRYRLIDAAAAESHLAFVLYSVGVDGEDDAGVEDPALPGRGLTDADHTGDHVFNPPAGASPEDDAGAPADAAPEVDP